MTMTITDNTHSRKRYPDGTYAMYADRTSIASIAHELPSNRIVTISLVEFDGGPSPRAAGFRRHQPQHALSSTMHPGTYERWYIGLSEKSMARLRKVLGIPVVTDWSRMVAHETTR